MKNKKTLLGLLLFVVMLLSTALFVSCKKEENPDTGKGEIYYLYENGELNKSNFIQLKDGKWSDDDNESGTYSISGDSVTIYVEIDGEKEEFAKGTLKDGVLTLTITGKTVVYCQEGKTPSSPSKPSEPIDDGHSVISSSECEINNKTLTAYIISPDGNYDLRDKFKVSDGASWRAFTSADCLQPTELTKRVADVEYGWNDVYVMVENQTTYESTVYDFKIYRAPVSSVTLLDDGTYSIDKGVDFPEVIIPSKYNGKIITVIGDSAFKDCNELTNVTIPDSVTSISEFAFENCSGLTSVTIPDGVTSISWGAFRGCSSLTSVTIPSNVVSIDQGAFTSCYKLVEVVNNSSLNITKGSSDNGDVAYYALNVKNSGNSDIVNQDGYLFYTNDGKNYLLGYVGNSTDLKLPETYNGNNYEIYKYAFKNCSELTNVKIPDSVVSIGDEAFYGCNSLESITLPFVGANLNGDKNTHFGYIFGASSYSYNYTTPSTLKTVIISNGSGVTSIDEFAFSGCSGLTCVTIGDGVTSIGSDAFYRCSGLTSVTIPDSVTSIGSSAFYGCSELTSITIPDGVTFIGDSAFNGCSGLTSVTIGDKVTSIGFNAFGSCSKLESITLPFADTYMGYIFGSRSYSDMSYTKLVPSSLKTVIVSGSSSVTSIGDYAFYNFWHVTSITIPNTVTSIGKEAFYRCSELESITLPFIGASKNADKRYDQVFGYIFGYNTTTQSDKTFSGATYQCYSSGTYYHYYIPSSLKNVILSDSVTSIGTNAFWNCSKLTSITIPDSVTSIGTNAFWNCKSLKYNKYDNGLYLGNGSNPYVALIKAQSTDITSCSINKKCKIVDESSFYSCSGLTSVTIPDSVTSIGDKAFWCCSKLTSVIIPDSVTSIGDYAFYACSKLTSITIPSSVTSIGKETFYSCSGLTSVTIPDSVTSIGYRAFYNCRGLTSVTIGTGVTSTGVSAFAYCSGLTSVTIPDSVTSIGDSAFLGCSKLASVTIPSSVTSIGDSAFSDCSKLTSVTIPSNVTSIGKETFYRCSGLTSVIIPDSVTSIGDHAFWYCSKLTSVIIPDNVTSIGDYAFYACSGLTSITIPDKVTSIGDKAFYDCSGLSEIRFNGTISQWQAISKGSFWNFSVPSSCKVICTDGETSL